MSSCAELCPYFNQRSKRGRCPNKSGMNIEDVLQECARRVNDKIWEKPPKKVVTVTNTLIRASKLRREDTPLLSI